MTETTRVVVAMSGGVDSSVAAALMKERGHEVIGVTLQLRPCDRNASSKSCCGIDGPKRARAVAGVLGIPHYVLNCEKEFEERILRPTWEAYAQGRTPSPCLWCNERIKFGVLLEWAKGLGIDTIATGHYASRVDDAAGNPTLLRAVDPGKDQTYFLARLGSELLKRIAFPLGGMRKAEVRALAARAGLPNADAPDSQDACLVGEGESFAEMLRTRFHAEAKPGPIVDTAGVVLGQHQGIHHFTIGQRKGLGIANTGRSWVWRIHPDTGAVVIAHDENELFAKELIANEVTWLGTAPATWPLSCLVQVRHRHAPTRATLTQHGDGVVRAVFAERVRAVTPGQAAVFYDGERVLGSGWIKSAE